jgi:hypothetical protein
VHADPERSFVEGYAAALAHLIDSGVPRGEAIDNLKLVVGDPDA